MVEPPDTPKGSLSAVGAYGLRLPDLSGTGLLNPDHPAAPLVRVSWGEGAWERQGVSRLSARSARFELEPGVVEIARTDRDDDGSYATVTYRSEAPLDPALIVHPFLARPVAMVSLWMGRVAFHGGAFLLDGAAWVVLGDREKGKSTLLAVLARDGHPVLCDDVVVYDGQSVFAGPRTIDLRHDAAEHLEGTTDLGVVGLRRRARLLLDAVPVVSPLAGFIVPDWGDEASVEPVPVRDRPRIVTSGMTLLVEPADPEVLLDAAVRPMVRFVRRRDWASVAESTTRLLAALSGR